jgi:hypothetical protein
MAGPHRTPPTLGRRPLLAALAGAVGLACSRPAPRPAPPPTPRDTAALAAWDADAREVLAQALGVLRTFDAFAAYRISRVTASSLRSPRELDWDPPTSAEWAGAQQAAGALNARATSLYQAVATSDLDPALWRERRALAAAARALADMGEWLVRYRDAAAELEPDADGSRALPALGRAWEGWETGSAYWGATTTELIGCG